jgi:hypothetical protein
MNGARQLPAAGRAPPWSQAPEDLFVTLGTEAGGLTETEAARRRQRDGPNVLRPASAHRGAAAVRRPVHEPPSLARGVTTGFERGSGSCPAVRSRPSGPLSVRNTKKYVRVTMSANFGNMVPMAAAPPSCPSCSVRSC